MNLGLSFIAQIQDKFTRKTLQDLVAAIGAGYDRQHNPNDTHSTITATGTIAERGRSVPMGTWQDRPLVTTDYTATKGSQWSVKAQNLVTYSYTLVGTTLFLTWQIAGSAVLVAAAQTLKIGLPTGAMITRAGAATFAYNDNGTNGIGVVQVNPDSGNVLLLTKNMAGSTTWSVSGSLSVMGQMALEVSGL